MARRRGRAVHASAPCAFALRWPDPWPAVFGYHEVFHTAVIAAALAHWFAVFSLAG